MSDSRPGSNTYSLALATRFGRKPRLTHFAHEGGAGWACEGGTMIVGVGQTPQHAYVDHVEEHWCLGGDFPDGYPG